MLSNVLSLNGVCSFEQNIVGFTSSRFSMSMYIMPSACLVCHIVLLPAVASSIILFLTYRSQFWWFR
jgi:hypothetical protein